MYMISNVDLAVIIILKHSFFIIIIMNDIELYKTLKSIYTTSLSNK